MDDCLLWAIFWKLPSSPYFCATFFLSIHNALMLTNYGFGSILGIFLQTHLATLALSFINECIGTGQSIHRKVAPGRLFTCKFLLFSIVIKNCNPSQWCHSIVWFTWWHHFSVHPDDVIMFFNSFFPAFWKFESDITHGSTFLYILWVQGCAENSLFDASFSEKHELHRTFFAFDIFCRQNASRKIISHLFANVIVAEKILLRATVFNGREEWMLYQSIGLYGVNRLLGSMLSTQFSAIWGKKGGVFLKKMLWFNFCIK
jgi:hypothetical protein